LRRDGGRKTCRSRRVAESSAAIIDEEAVALLECDGLELADAIIDVRVGRENVFPAVVVDVRDN
jgi:hypothetical protein